MASDTPKGKPAVSAPATPRRPWLAIALFTLAAPILAATLAVAWILTTESGTRTLLSLLERQLPLEASGVRGSLINALQIDRVQLAAGEQRIVLENMYLQWRPWQLRNALLDIERISVRSMTIITHAGKDVPPPMPATLALPFRLSLKSLAVGELHIKRDAQWLLAAENVLLSLHFDGSRHHLQLAQMQLLPRGTVALSSRLSGELSVAARPPFTVAGHGQLRGAHAEGKAEGTLHIDGTLTALAARFDLHVQREVLQTRVTGLVRLQPFMPQPFAGAQLHAQALDLATLVPGWPRTRIDASVAMHTSSGGRFVLTNAIPGPLERQRLPLADVQGSFSLRPDALQLSSLRLNHDAFRGSIGLRRTPGGSEWQVQGRLGGVRLADWLRVDGLPNIVLRGEIDARGSASPRPRGKLMFSLNDSRIGRWPLSGKADIRIDARSIEINTLDLRAGANRLHADGRVGMTGGDLSFALTAPRLAQLGTAYQGSADIEGRLSGTVDASIVTLRWRADALRLADKVAIGSARGTLRAGSTLDAPLHITAEGEQLAVAGRMIDSLRLSADGKLAQHTLRVTLQRGTDRLQAHASGGLNALTTRAHWQGSLHAIDLQGRLAVRSEQAAPLRIDRESLELRRLQLRGELGGIMIDRLALDARHWSSSGRIEALRVAPLLRRVRQETIASTDLVLEGDWNIMMPLEGGPSSASGTALLRRRSGDLVLSSGEQRIVLGLSVLAVEARAVGERVALTAELQGRELGTIGFGGSIGTGSHGQLAGGTAAIDGVLDLKLPSVAAAATLAWPKLVASGSMTGRMFVTGTVADPRLSGQLAGRDLRLLLVDSGFALNNGKLDVLMTGNAIDLRELSFAGSGGRGRVILSGPVRFDHGHAAGTLDWRLEHFLAFDRVDRQLELSGNGHLNIGDKRLDLRGKATVERAFFDIGRADAPALSDDVEIVGKAAPAPTALALGLDVTLALGEQIRLRGRGLDARIGGALRLASTSGEPLSARGEVRVMRGTYRAYGRELAIERGSLRFDGPPGNPALDIRAMRREAEVAAGVSIVGTAKAPRVSLVSEPQLPDAEKLSWLVLGHGLSGTSGAQVGLLQSAAGALLAQGAAAGVQSHITSALGVDSITMGRRQDNLQQRIVSVGKRVSSRLFLSYQHGLQTAGSTVLLRYMLSPRITIEAETGMRSVFSVFYNFSFD
jgi:translocation and assembly module TamB